MRRLARLFKLTRIYLVFSQVSLSSYAFLFAEIVKYSHHNEKHVRDVERRYVRRMNELIQMFETVSGALCS